MRSSPSASGCAASAITGRWPASSWGRARWAARSEPATRDAIVRELKAIGYRYVTLDLQGYRMGSLNEGVRLEPV